MAIRTVEQLHEQLDSLAAEDVRTAPQGDTVIELAQLAARLDAELARRLVAMGNTGEHQVSRCKTVKQWFVQHTRCSGAEAARRVRTGRELAELPATMAAWQAGELTTGHADLIAKARHAADADEQFGEFEPAMLRFAKTSTPEGLNDLLTHWRDALDNDLDRDGAESRTGAQRDARRFDFSRSFEGVGIGEFVVAPDGAEIVELALGAAYAQLHREGDSRTPAQQRADAFVEIFRTFLSVQSGRANLPNVMVLWSAETMLGDALGDCNLASGARIDPKAAERIACDAFIQHVLAGDDGVPLMLGRQTRTFTPDQYRAMVIRDGGCRGPGCHAPPDRCQGHHLHHPWNPHGRTDLDDGILACTSCHPDLHEHGIQVFGDPNGELRFYDKHGNHLGSTFPRGVTPQIPLEPDRRGLLIELDAPNENIDDPRESDAA